MSPTTRLSRPRRARPGLLLRPAVALMNRLTYPKKFLAISLLFVAPLAVAMYFLITGLNDDIEFTTRESLGTRYLRPLSKAFRHAAEARRMARSYSQGDRATRPALVRKHAELEDHFKAVESVDRELGEKLQSTNQLSVIRKNWDFLRDEALRAEAPQVDRLYVDLIGDIRKLISLVGDTSNLILDPDLDTYYLMDAVLLKLPEGQERLMNARFTGEAAVRFRQVGPQQRAEFIVLLGLIADNREALRSGMETAFKNNPSRTLRPRLEKHYDDFVAALKGYHELFNREVIDAPTIQGDPATLVAASNRSLDLSFDLWDRTTDELDELLDIRANRFIQRRLIAAATTGLGVGLVAYLWVAFYAAVMRTVWGLEDASERMLGGDPGEKIVLETRDELGRVTESFNAVAQRLRREWEQAHEENARARAAEARVLESEERTRMIVQSALDAVISIDSEGKIQEWNSQAAAMFGWTREEVLGQRLSERIIPPQYREKHEEGLRRFAKTGEGALLNRRIEISGLRRSGDEFPIEVSITPIRRGTTVSFSAFLRDITERKRAEQELKSAKESAEAANQAKSKFLASMSHELRTPLNSVIGFSNVLLKGKGKHLGEQDAAYLERILDNGKHLLNLINSVLDLSKVEAGKMELIIARIDLAKLVSETLAQLEGRLVDKKEVKLAADLPSQLPPFETDAEKLKQVLINLVGNALKFTERGSVTVRVAADPSDGRAVRIDVADTGMGIPADMKDKIFDAFQQGDTGTARKYEGTGLGLTISRSLCRLLGYRLEVQSEVGKGSTFSIHLTPPARIAAPAPMAAEPSGHHDAHLDGRLVLIIDDEADSRLLLRQHLMDCGCKVVEASSGSEALRMAKEQRPAFITLDLLLPDMNGWEILRDLKSDPALREIPVVVVSIVAAENRGTIFGAADVLTKPVSREDLCDVLRRNVPNGRGKVLVVDDDASSRRVISEYLAAEHLEIRTAENGEEALKRLQDFPADLVILDLMMPVMDGMQFLDVVRRDARYGALKVVVATAKDLTLQEIQQLEASVSVVLKKGGDLQADLAKIVGSLVGHRGPAPGDGGKITVRVRPLVAGMVDEFLSNRRGDVAAIDAALAREDFEAIRVLGHNMKGIGSAYGFEPITAIGRALEEAAEAKASDEIRKQGAALADYLARVEVVK